MRAIVLSNNLEFNKEFNNYFQENGILTNFVETLSDVEDNFHIRNYDIFIADSSFINYKNEEKILDLMFSSEKLLKVVLGNDSGNKIMNNIKEIEFLRLGIDEYIRHSANIEIIYLRIFNYLKLNEARRSNLN